MDFAEHARQFVTDHGYLAVFLGILLENFGLPTPGETILIAGAVLAARGELNILYLLPVAWAAAVLGNSIGFLIGATGGHKLLIRYGAKIGITEERLQRVERFFARYGDVALVFARFFIIVRQFSGIAAGALEMPWPRFFFYNALGAALWVGSWGGATYWLGKEFFDYLRAFGWSGQLILVIGALIAVGIIAQVWWHWRASHGASETIASHNKSKPGKS